jgi:N-acetylmuramoyl-L-alanine amidase
VIRRRAVVLLLSTVGVLVGACGGGDETDSADEAVQSVDAAAAAAARANLGEPAPPPITAGSTGDDPDGAAGGADEGGSATSVAEGDPYPAIETEIFAIDDGVSAVRSPSGVLLVVTGRTAGGRVVTTPCGFTTVLEGGEPVGDIAVVIDPGHGGSEAGAEDIPNLSEAKLNLALAKRTEAELTARGISVVLTRDEDFRITVRQRAAIADAVGPEIFISIHHNTPASRASATPGTEVYVQQGVPASRRLGGLLHQSVVDALATNFGDVEWTARDDAGVLVVLNDDGEDAYGIARYPATPSALVEMAYMGNPSEAEMLSNPDYLEIGAVALADGIERFLTTDASGTDPAGQPRIFNPSGRTGGVDGCVDPPLG